MTLHTNNGNAQDKVSKQNNDLVGTIKKLNEEKIGYKNAIVKLEDEIRQYKRNQNKVCKKFILFFFYYKSE